ncbi:MAG: septal ring lytic transglycosylase RlpA family protein [Wenzhouxiangella sp.]|nr:MAG: septal ring lytic transglycosylase RlpA family protein [Wenzhouxiangella sp.]
MRRFALAALALAVVACAPPVRDTGPVRGTEPERDGPPVSGTFDPSRIQYPVPRAEPRSPYGNHSPYRVLGVTYEVLPSASGYREVGIASWYGTKFHGRATSSGEPYDMYQLTAAHRTLPLPTFAEVRHLENGRSIIVRINDRGPFHPDRIIDLSWAAAVKLGIDQSGTGPVEVTAITFSDPLTYAVGPARLPVLLQVGAFSEQAGAERVSEQLRSADIGPVRSENARTPQGRVWRVQVGPIAHAEEAIRLVDQIDKLGLGRARFVYP